MLTCRNEYINRARRCANWNSLTHSLTAIESCARSTWASYRRSEQKLQCLWHVNATEPGKIDVECTALFGGWMTAAIVTARKTATATLNILGKIRL